jgi:hypothetical protein
MSIVNISQRVTVGSQNFTRTPITFLGVHLAKNPRPLLAQQSARTPKNLDFRPFDITFYSGRSRSRMREIVERNALHKEIRHLSFIGDKRTYAAVR